MRKVLVVGFQPYDERMYPHVYDFLKVLESAFKVIYTNRILKEASDIDDRGLGLIYTLRCLLSTENFVRIFGSHIYKYSLMEHFMRNRELEKQIESVASSGVDLAIAIDHYALNCVSRFVTGKMKLIFWSLDYIAPDSDLYRYRLTRLMIERNRENIKKSSSIIVQDINRAAVLDSILGSHTIPKFYLPVSLRDDEFARNTAGRKANDISRLKNRIVLMQLNPWPMRSSDLLIKAFQDLDDSIELYLHRTVSREIIDLIAISDKKPRVFPACDSYDDMRRNISQADIGFLSYALKNINCHFMSKSCGQMVEFMRLGIPIIVLDAVELGQYVENNGYGIHISHAHELENAIRRIVDNYSLYSKAAREMYEQVFRMENYEGECLNMLSSL